MSGANVELAICSTPLIALCYTFVSGLKASIFTDVIQMLMVLLICALLVPWCLLEADGLRLASLGAGGVTGEHRSLFDPWIAFTMGIPMTLGLIAGPINDQTDLPPQQPARHGHNALSAMEYLG